MNAGLAALGAPPFEYLALRSAPCPGATRIRSCARSPCTATSRAGSPRRSPCSACCGRRSPPRSRRSGAGRHGAGRADRGRPDPDAGRAGAGRRGPEEGEARGRRPGGAERRRPCVPRHPGSSGDGRRRVRPRQQQLGGGGDAHDARRRARRQRHAPRHLRPQHLVPAVARLPGRGRGEAHDRRHVARCAVRGGGQQRPRGLGLHEQRG